MTIHDTCDVAVIGGGAAGLTAAIALSRFDRDVVVVDAGRPRNAPADGMHNFLSRDGFGPLELVATGREELARFGGRVVEDVAVGATREDGRIVVGLRSGGTVSARRLVVASGTTDLLPDVDGLAERWGREVVHCPYCHGWEVRGHAIGVLATDPAAAVQQALMFAELSDDVRVLAHTSEPLSEDQLAQLAARGIEVVEGTVAALVVAEDELTGVRLADGSVLALRTVVVATGLETRSAVLDDLGVHRQEDGPGGYVADAVGATSAEGVWIAGNVADPYAPLIVAAASGMTAAGQVNGDLIAERARRALENA